MNCQQCKTPFRADQIVFVVKNDEGVPVNCCRPECADEVEAKLRQAEIFKIREERIYKVTEVSNVGCHFSGVTASPSKDGMKKILKIAIPMTASVDEILRFDDQPVTLKIMQERLDDIEKPSAECHSDHEEPVFRCLAMLLAKTGTEREEKAAKIWAEGREFGMTDDELVAHFNDLVGNSTGKFEDEFIFETKAGAKPKFWFGTDTIGKKPTMQGKELLKAMRDLLGIADPETVKKKTEAA